MTVQLINGLVGAFNDAMFNVGVAILDAIGRLAVFIVTELAARLALEWPARAVEFVQNLFAEIVKQAVGPDAIAKLGEITTSILGFFTGLPEKIAGAAVGMWDGIYDAFKGAINLIIDAWNGLEFRLEVPSSGVIGKLAGLLGVDGSGFTLSTPDVQRLAGGGVFDKATAGFFQLAETPAARPEIVTPQKLLAATFRKELATVGAGGGGGVHFGDIVVNGAQASPQSIADAVFAKAGWLHFTGRREL